MGWPLSRPEAPWARRSLTPTESVSAEGRIDSPPPARHRYLCDSACAWRVAQSLVKVAVWSFFVERFLQLSLVNWRRSERLKPVEQLGGTLLEDGGSDAKWADTRALLRGISASGRRSSDRSKTTSVMLLCPEVSSSESSTPEMFAKVDCTEVLYPSASSPALSIPRKEREREQGQWQEEERGREDEDEYHEEKHPQRNPVMFYEYAGPVFGHLRSLYGVSGLEFRRSFPEGSGTIALASNSKSPQSFMFSEDGKYLLKTASESELQSMLLLLPKYTEHVSRRQGSLITRFFGIYRVTNPDTRRSTAYVVSSNVFSTEKRLQERYDLKGSVVGRRALPPREDGSGRLTAGDRGNSSSSSARAVMMKDMDLVGGNSKLLLAEGYKSRLMAELKADAEFLAEQGVMDYSLLVGVHRPSKRSPPKALAIPLSLISIAARPASALGSCVAGIFSSRGGRRGSPRRRPSQVGIFPGREPGVLYYVGIIDILQRYNLRKILERSAKGVIYDRDEISAVPPERYRDRFLEFIDANTE